MSRRRGREEEEESDRERRRTRSRRDRSESAENQPHHFQFPPGGFIMYPLDPNHPYMGYPFAGPASSRQQPNRGRAPTQQQSSRGRAPAQQQSSRGRAPTQQQSSRGRAPTQQQSSRSRREQEEGEEGEEGEEEEEVYDDNWARGQGYQMSPSAEPEAPAPAQTARPPNRQRASARRSGPAGSPPSWARGPHSLHSSSPSSSPALVAHCAGARRPPRRRLTCAAPLGRRASFFASSFIRFRVPVCLVSAPERLA